MKDIPAFPAVHSLHSSGHRVGTGATCTAIHAALALLAATAAHAGVKYWDDPSFRAFDADSYVAGDLVVHLDGIRNAGLGKPHDPEATVWTNLAEGQADADIVHRTADGSAWTDDAYFFASNTYARLQSAAPATECLTMEAYGDFAASYQKYAWPSFIGGDVVGDDFAVYTSGGDKNKYGWLYCKPKKYGTDGYGSVGRAYIVWNRTDFSAVIDETSVKMYQGGTLASGATDLATIGRVKKQIPDMRWIVGCQHYTEAYLTGTDYSGQAAGYFNAVRIYNRALSADEVAWNHAVDLVRFKGTAAVIPVTNVVVATTVPGDAETHFALDAEGFTFTAPAQHTVKGARYVLAGYSLEKWDGSAWGAADTHDGESSCTLADTSAKVRLTWRYERPEGEGRLVVYDAGDYVQGGLVVHFDGIRNAGSGAPHNAGAKTWTNLGSAGSASDATLVKGDEASAWTDDAYRFGGTTKFTFPNQSNTGSYTLQFVLDADHAAQRGTTQYCYLLSGSYNKFAVAATHNDVGAMSLRAGADVRAIVSPAGHMKYFTGVNDGTGETRTAYAFAGTTYGSGRSSTSENLVAPSISSFALGGWGGTDLTQYFVGAMKCFRYYDRPLKEDELAQNRRVDDWRFFGVPAATNVLVQSTYSYLGGNEPSGAYEVEDSYTFTAPEAVTAENGISYACDGYVAEAWDGANWREAARGGGNAYLYEESAGLVRLTWRWKPVSGLRTAADYSFEDLAAGALVFYDGIRNQGGTDADHSDAATTWKNIGTGGAAYDLSLAKKVDGDTGHWTRDGYDFSGAYVFASTRHAASWLSYTVEFLVDSDKASQAYNPGYVFSASWSNFAFGIGNNPAVGCFHFNAQGAANRPYILNDAKAYMWATAISDATAGEIKFFDGPSAPTGGSLADGYCKFASPSDMKPVSYTSGSYAVGGYGSADGQFVGTLKSMRIYDRVLTDEEIARNRNVDAVRHFGRLGVTNVVVAVEEGSGIVPAETAGEAYFVEGSHVFRAAGPSGTGYRLFVPDGKGGWRAQGTFRQETEFAYESGDSPECVRLEWRIQKPLVFIVR